MPTYVEKYSTRKILFFSPGRAHTTTMASRDSKPDLEKVETSSDERGNKSGIEYERAQLLANLPDPDEGKSDEERRAIVSRPFSIAPAVCRVAPMSQRTEGMAWVPFIG